MEVWITIIIGLINFLSVELVKFLSEKLKYKIQWDEAKYLLFIICWIVYYFAKNYLPSDFTKEIGTMALFSLWIATWIYRFYKTNNNDSSTNI